VKFYRSYAALWVGVFLRTHSDGFQVAIHLPPYFIDDCRDGPASFLFQLVKPLIIDIIMPFHGLCRFRHHCRHYVGLFPDDCISFIARRLLLKPSA